MILFAIKIAFVARILNAIINSVLPKIMNISIIKNNIKKPQGQVGSILYDLLFGAKKSGIQLSVLTALIVLVAIIFCPPNCESSSSIS